MRGADFAGFTKGGLMLAAVAVGGYVLYKAYKTGAAVTTAAVEVVTKDLNPINQDNVANRGFNWIYQGLTGSDGTPGTDAYDWIETLKNKW